MKRTLLLCVAIWMSFSAAVFAHSMPRSEMYVGGVGAGCTLGYVQSIYGEPTRKDYATLDFVHIVRYIYSDTFDVIGRTAADYEGEEENIPVSGFSLSDSSLTTPSGFTVGSSYEQIVATFGEGERVVINGETGYSYMATDSPVELTFFVDRNNIVTRIYEGTEI
ncbi:MAG: hypothetical protein K6C05_05315 [Anaerovibrio sp.]|uniref:hypothetical protein n=1 Tax=Anaerovibrio sp. TaxID=1872532 RepID=UPI0025E66374|nr:hypothetical protein [Anaerovibrio sp.]MCR5176251.1 hypothetical protein [Anaerovibrio sp.]